MRTFRLQSLCVSFTFALLVIAVVNAQVRAEDVGGARQASEAVRSSNHFVAAIREYERALKVDRDYAPALKHLAETYILYGKSLEAFPSEAIKQFHRAYYFDSANSDIEDLIDRAVQRLNLDPRSIRDRRALGEAAFERGDFVDCVIELKMARKIRDVADIDKKLMEAQNKLDGTLYGGRLKDTEVEAQKVDKTDFGPYMSALQKQIKSCWQPPRLPDSKACTVLFKVERNGALKDLKLSKSSGVSAFDMSALSAVSAAVPFSPLPDDSRDSVDIQFAFDNNNNPSAKANVSSNFSLNNTVRRCESYLPSLGR